MSGGGKAERVKPEVRISILPVSSVEHICPQFWFARAGILSPLLRQEKDEASPFPLVRDGIVDALHNSRLAESEGFFISRIFRPRAGLSIPNPSAFFRAEN